MLELVKEKNQVIPKRHCLIISVKQMEFIHEKTADGEVGGRKGVNSNRLNGTSATSLNVCTYLKQACNFRYPSAYGVCVG